MSGESTHPYVSSGFIFLTSWFPHQLALLLSFISTCFMLRCCQWSTNIPLLYFQIPLNCSSKGADCICCTISLHTVPLFVWFDFFSVSIIIAHKTIQFLIFFQMEDRVKESNYMLQEKSENVHTCNSTTTSMTASTTTGIRQWWIISTPTDGLHLSYIQRWKWKISRQLLWSSTVQKLRVISGKARSWSAYPNKEKWL